MEDGGWRMEDGGWRMEDGFRVAFHSAKLPVLNVVDLVKDPARQTTSPASIPFNQQL
jgi:hypothetical protein